MSTLFCLSHFLHCHKWNYNTFFYFFLLFPIFRYLFNKLVRFLLAVKRAVIRSQTHCQIHHHLLTICSVFCFYENFFVVVFLEQRKRWVLTVLVIKFCPFKVLKIANRLNFGYQLQSPDTTFSAFACWNQFLGIPF